MTERFDGQVDTRISTPSVRHLVDIALGLENVTQEYVQSVKGLLQSSAEMLAARDGGFPVFDRTISETLNEEIFLLPLGFQDGAHSGNHGYFSPNGKILFYTSRPKGPGRSEMGIRLREATDREYVKFAPETLAAVLHREKQLIVSDSKE